VLLNCSTTHNSVMPPPASNRRFAAAACLSADVAATAAAAASAAIAPASSAHPDPDAACCNCLASLLARFRASLGPPRPPRPVPTGCWGGPLSMVAGPCDTYYSRQSRTHCLYGRNCTGPPLANHPVAANPAARLAATSPRFILKCDCKRSWGRYRPQRQHVARQRPPIPGIVCARLRVRYSHVPWTRTRTRRDTITHLSNQLAHQRARTQNHTHTHTPQTPTHTVACTDTQNINCEQDTHTHTHDDTHSHTQALPPFGARTHTHTPQHMHKHL
jgi:hypothetical protein